MRTKVRDRQEVYIALRLPPVDLVDGTGLKIGEVVQYDTPIKYLVTVMDVDSEAEIAVYGEHVKQMKKIVATPVLILANEAPYMSAVWIGKTPGTSAYADPIETETTTVIPAPLDNNYVVCKEPEYNSRQVVVYLESVIGNA